MTREEREVAIWQEWQELGKQIQREIDEQRSRGRVKVTRTQHPDGTETIEQVVVSGADPNLLKALGQHLDRKARQLLDQMPVADSTQNVQINLVKDFLSQADNSSRQLSAEDWNSKQTIDVPRSPRPGSLICTRFARWRRIVAKTAHRYCVDRLLIQQRTKIG